MSTVNVLDCGARGDGTTNDAAAIQQAVDDCSGKGGGTVLLPAGRTFLAGTFELKSNVEFRVERGARLIASSREEDYTLKVFKSGPEVHKKLWIRARDAENIALTGGGVIDGRCLEFADKELSHIYQGKIWRPAMTCFVGCRNLRVTDITLKDAANWALHFAGCEDIVVHGISILNNLKFPNCDGIDPDHCRNVRISDCYIQAGDDCIVIKNTEGFRDYGPSENITVTGCTLISTSCAIKLGSESWDDFRDIVFDACVIKASNRGVGLQIRDQGSVENVLFSNMVIETRLFYGGWWGAAEPIYVTSIPRMADRVKVGGIRNVVFRNILCRGENGVYVRGSNKGQPDGVLFDGVRVEIDKTSRWEGGVHDPRPCPVEELQGETPVDEQTPWGQKVRGVTSGFHLQNAGRVELRNCEVVWGKKRPDYFGPAVTARNVRELMLNGFHGEAAHPSRTQSIVRE